MRTKWRRRITTLGSLCVLGLIAAPASANGWGLFERNYIVSPTAYYEVVPTSYVVPTTYVMPTTYLAPTTYAIAPTVYVGTSYTVPTTRYYVERPVYATSHHVRTAYAYPTTYVYAAPTFYEAPVAPSPCCESGPSAPVAPSKGPAKLSASAAPAKATPKEVVSEPSEPGMATDPDAPADNATTKRDTAPPKNPVTSSAVDAAEASPPVAPAPDKSNDPAAPATGTTLTPNPSATIVPAPVVAPAPAPVPPPTKNTEETKKQADATNSPVKTKPPIAPTDESPSLPLPEEPGAAKRESMRPVLNASRLPFKRSGRELNVLEGKVLSVDSGRPEEGVRLTITSKSETIADREALTDAFGHYAVRLPDGDWTVKVTTAKGKVFSVSNLVVSRGQIRDDLGRDIPSLTITR